LDREKLHTVIRDIIGEVPHSFAYIFDNDCNDFIYTSRPDEKLERAIARFCKEVDMDHEIRKSENRIISLTDAETKHTFFFRRMAANLIFGLAVSTELSQDQIEFTKDKVKNIFNAD